MRTLLVSAPACVLLALLACDPAPAASDASAPSAPSSTAASSAMAQPTPSTAGSVAAPPAIAAAVGAVLDDWHDAAAKADEPRYFAHFTADGVFMGTDATERWDVPAFRAYAHPHFAKGKAWSFRATRRAVMSDAGGNLAWFDEDLTTAGLGPARGSGVLRREADGRWRIAHYNLTITVPNERMDEVKSLLAGPAVAGPDAGAGDAGTAAAGDGGTDAGGKSIAKPAPKVQPQPDLDTRK